MKREDFLIANDIFGINVKHEPDGRQIVEIHSGDDEYYSPEPRLTFGMWWLPKLVGMLKHVENAPRKRRR